MRRCSPLVPAVVAAIVVAGCAKEPSTGPVAPLASAAPEAGKEPGKPAGALEEIDLSAWGPAWKGYVAMAPASAKVTADGSSRYLNISEADYLKVTEAPFFEDAVAGLPKDPDNKNIVKASPTEVTYERNPPAGKQWSFNTLVMLGKDKWSCTAETFTSAEVSKQLLRICKSIKKK